VVCEGESVKFAFIAEMGEEKEQKSQLTAICKPCAGTAMSSISRDRTTPIVD
jgi:hypothetical protein